MTSRERVLTAINHKKPDRVPVAMGFGIQPPAKKELQAYLGLKSTAEVDSYLTSINDLRWITPDYCGPKNRNITLSDGSLTSIWGIVRKPVSYGAGTYNEISYYPLADAKDSIDLSNHLWPSSDWFDFSRLKDTVNDLNKGPDNRYAICTGIANIFETSWYMRGFEQMFVDLIDEPELAWEIMTRVTDYYIAYFTKLLQSADGLVDIVFTADDLGGQEGLLMSPVIWERMIKPHHVRLNKVLHEYGVKILYHTDGAVMEAVPGLIDMGIDILEALQFDAKGMDPALLKEQYGDRLCFHGGISVQKTLPFGTAEEVRAEVAERARVLGKNGGYIISPSHAIQAGTPAANIAAFLEEAVRLYY